MSLSYNGLNRLLRYVYSRVYRCLELRLHKRIVICILHGSTSWHGGGNLIDNVWIVWHVQ